MKKRIFSLIIAFVMVFALAIPCFADDDLSGKLYILHTNDVHGAIDGYAKLAAFRDELVSKGADVIIADAGDYCQGQPTVSYTKGADAIRMMNAVGYDVATLGNHEFDYGVPQLISNMSIRTFPVVCATIFDEDNSYLFDGPFAIISKGGVNVGFVGIATPETLTKANPALVKDLTILTNTTDPSIYDAVENSITMLKAKGANVIIGLAHLGVNESATPYKSSDLYNSIYSFNFIIDGHSHTVMTEGPNGEPIQSTGTGFANIGVIVIDEATRFIVDNYLQPVDEISGTNEEVAALAQEIHEKVDAAFGTPFARSEVELNGEKAPGNRTEETNNGDMIADAMLWSLTEQYPGSIEGVPAENILAITNGGGIRAKIAVGDITRGDINTVLPFGNTLAVIYVKGTELLEALEASTFATPGSNGGFPQVSGIKITIDTTKAYDPLDETYPSSTYHGPKSIQRVTINEINGKPFDPDATYAVITNNFLAAGGDTYYAFAAATDQFDTGFPVDEVVMDYISEKLGGVITAAQYGQPQGRIVILPASQDEEPEEPVSPPTFDKTLISLCVMIGAYAIAVVMLPRKKEY